jgi:3-phenylpropionate/cinnamic acid dioxygenase small subunit
MFEDWHAIQTLLVTYAEFVDSGRFADCAALFANASYRLEHADTGQVSTYHGAAEVEKFMATTRLYPDGTPRTKHTVTNIDIRLNGDQATSRCYVTVFQQTDVLPLQPIASGRYIDRFERVDGQWRFSERVLTGFLLGDRSQHVPWHEGTPDDGAA